MQEPQKPIQYHDIILTDIRIHTTAIRKPKSFGRMLMKSIRSNLSGRVFNKWNTPDQKSLRPGEAKFSMPLPTAEELYKIPELRGKTVRFLVPKAGLPVYAGKDTVEFVKARENRKWSKVKKFVGL